jgi:hypothetical protein
LQSLVDLCEHHDAAVEERRALAALVAELGDVDDTVSMQRTRAVLATKAV